MAGWPKARHPAMKHVRSLLDNRKWHEVNVLIEEYLSRGGQRWSLLVSMDTWLANGWVESDGNGRIRVEPPRRCGRCRVPLWNAYGTEIDAIAVFAARTDRARERFGRQDPARHLCLDCTASWLRAHNREDSIPALLVAWEECERHSTAVEVSI